MLIIIAYVISCSVLIFILGGHDKPYIFITYIQH